MESTPKGLLVQRRSVQSFGSGHQVMQPNPEDQICPYLHKLKTTESQTLQVSLMLVCSEYLSLIHHPALSFQPSSRGRNEARSIQKLPIVFGGCCFHLSRPVFIVFVGHALAQLKTLFDLQLDPYIPSTGIVWIKHLVVTRPRKQTIA